MSNEVPFDYPSACREFCPVQRDFAVQHEMGTLAIGSIQSLAEQKTANKWHAAYHLTNGTPEQTTAQFQSELSVVAPYEGAITQTQAHLESLSTDELEKFFEASKDTADRATTHLQRSVLEATEAHAMDLEASCRFGPQLARIAIDSKKNADPTQDTEATYVVCLEKNTLSSSPISAADKYELSESIANDRNLNLIADMLDAHPDALEAVRNYEDNRSLDTE